MAYADDLSEAGNISDLKEWWGLVNDNDPIIGYTPNAGKSVFIVKPEHYDGARETFSGSGVIITKHGQRQLGPVVGTEEFKEYIGEKVTEWVRAVNVLSDVAKTEPHAAYSAYTHGLQHRHAHHPRHQPSPYTAEERYKEHLTSATEISHHQG